jgi:ubiquinone/menaquinone biosynthesis C-methylase UbiE
MPEESIVFDRAASFYDQTRGFPPGIDREVGAFIAQAAGLTKTSQLIEIGVGTGRIALPVAEHVRQIIGIDLSTGMMGHLLAKREADFAGVRVLPVQGDVMQLPAASGQFDAALIVHILHLIPQPERAVQELARVLRPGGQALLCWNDRSESAFKPLTDAWEKVIQTGPVNTRRWHGDQSIFNEMDWHDEGEQVYQFTTYQSPDELMDRYRKRVFSASWSLSDEVWQAGIDAMEAILREKYPDPHTPLPMQSSFHVRRYIPPA